MPYVQPSDLTYGPIYLLGATSIVGYNVIIRHPRAVTGVVTSRLRHPVVRQWPRLSLDDPAAVQLFCAGLPPTAAIIYCDAVCDVSKCEENPAWAREINVANLRRFLHCLPAHLRFVYVSSDHVFGSDGTYGENSPTCPVSLYGAIRAEAEQLALTRSGALLIRAGLPIGPSLDGKSGHLDWLRYRLGRQLPVTIVEDEARTAVPSPLLADRILALTSSNLSGIRHVPATRLISRVELANTLKNYFDFPGQLSYSVRAHQPAPHLGRIHLTTLHSDALSQPLPCPADLLETSSHLLTSNYPPVSFPDNEPQLCIPHA